MLKHHLTLLFVFDIDPILTISLISTQGQLNQNIKVYDNVESIPSGFIR